MTAPLIVTVVLAISVLGAHLGNTIVRLTLIRLAFRDSKPTQRTAILDALTPALHAVADPKAARIRTVAIRRRPKP